jgi:hypothetical protein
MGTIKETEGGMKGRREREREREKSCIKLL